MSIDNSVTWPGRSVVGILLYMCKIPARRRSVVGLGSLN